MPSVLDLVRRPRRNRSHPAIRGLIQETHLHPSDFVAPFFVQEGSHEKIALQGMPHVFRFTIDTLLPELHTYLECGISTINLFCYTPQEKKDPFGTEATLPGNLLQQTIKAIKKEFPELFVMADIALDPFTSHGHDGLVQNNKIINDETVHVLAEMALRAAESGVDMISPSDMMDGRIGFLRHTLDQYGFTDVGICSYAAKYASSFYGPFRYALDSTPSFGDKKSYQMNPANYREALLECALDEKEGADLLLIKPALSNLDVISKVREATYLPVGAYHVSGEYAMIMAAAEKGLINAEAALYETHLCIKRAGADFIFTYAAKQLAGLL